MSARWLAPRWNAAPDHAPRTHERWQHTSTHRRAHVLSLWPCLSLAHAHMHRFANAGLEAGLGWAGLGWAGLGRAGPGWAGQGINRGAKDRMRTVAISAPHLLSAASSAFASSSVLPRISASVCANQSSCHICTGTPSRASSARLRRIGTQSSQTCAKKLDRRIGCCDRQQRIEQNGNVLNQPTRHSRTGSSPAVTH